MTFPVIDTTRKRCRKQGHKSRGAAEAHLRGLQKAQSFKPDMKSGIQMIVYYCIAKRCQSAPWHVGHDKHAKIVQ